MKKPYQRGNFRVTKNHLSHYVVQARDYRDTTEWVSIGTFDYLANARLRVRNLHAASFIMADLTKPTQWDAAKHDLTNGLKYFKAQ